VAAVAGGLIDQGVAFGAGGEGSVRIYYAADLSILEPAMERLGRFLRDGRV
jgi:bifunctional pyridoxal-dependent enzyme with beta-cystathionase and maltose regulon repressor activities